MGLINNVTGKTYGWHVFESNVAYKNVCDIRARKIKLGKAIYRLSNRINVLKGHYDNIVFNACTCRHLYDNVIWKRVFHKYNSLINELENNMSNMEDEYSSISREEEYCEDEAEMASSHLGDVYSP
jgi:hypothetical protein